MPTGKRPPLTGAGRAFLVSTLKGSDLPTYGQFVDNVGDMPNGNGPLLESIAAECLDNGEPDLTVLVVGKESGVPSWFQGRAAA